MVSFSQKCREREPLGLCRVGDCVPKQVSVSQAQDDHREAGGNCDRGDQDGHNSFGKGEIRELALQGGTVARTLRAGTIRLAWNSRSDSFIRPDGFGLTMTKRRPSFYSLVLSLRFVAMD